jgi:hypothetical protein
MIFRKANSDADKKQKEAILACEEEIKNIQKE